MASNGQQLFTVDGCVSEDDAYFRKLGQLENFLSDLVDRTSSKELERLDEDAAESSEEDTNCCICYATAANAMMMPCCHRSCYGCITRHLLNCQRCFFCNATVTDVVKDNRRNI